MRDESCVTHLLQTLSRLFIITTRPEGYDVTYQSENIGKLYVTAGWLLYTARQEFIRNWMVLRNVTRKKFLRQSTVLVVGNLSYFWFSDDFDRLGKSIVNFVMSVSLSVSVLVRLRRTTGTPLDGFSWNFLFQFFFENLSRTFISL